MQNIAQPLVTIINTSLSTGVFPESLKIAKVIPVFKNGLETKISRTFLGFLHLGHEFFVISGHGT